MRRLRSQRQYLRTVMCAAIALLVATLLMPGIQDLAAHGTTKPGRQHSSRAFFPGAHANRAQPASLSPLDVTGAPPVHVPAAGGHRRPHTHPAPPKRIHTKPVQPGHGGNEVPAGWLPPTPTRPAPTAAPAGGPTAAPSGPVGSLCIAPCSPPLASSGGSVLHHPHVVLIFWGPKWTDSNQTDYATYSAIINQEQTLFNNLAGSGYNQILAQYDDYQGKISNDTVLVETDEDSTTPPDNIDQHVEATEINQVASQIPQTSDVVYMLFPQAESTYTDSSVLPKGKGCAYHYVSVDGNNNLYALMPYVGDDAFSAGCLLYGEHDEMYSGSDVVTAAMTVITSHEYAEAVTDPYVNNTSTLAWHDKSPDLSKTNEIGDICAPENAYSQALGGVWVQPLFDNLGYATDHTRGCDAGSVSLGAGPKLVPDDLVLSESASSTLTGVATLANSPVWAVGSVSDYSHNPGEQALIERWSSVVSGWEVVNAPTVPNSGDEQLVSVAAVAANDVWAAGQYFDNTSLYIDQTLIEHYDGTQWSVVPSPNLVVGDYPDGNYTDNALYGIAARSASDVWAVGEAYDEYSGVDTSLVEHYDGTQWSIIPGPPAFASYGGGLNRVTIEPGTGDLWVTGARFTDTATLGLVARYDGTSWTVTQVQNPSASYDYIWDVAAASPTDVWAVGTYRTNTGTQQVLLEHYDGTTWLTFTPTDENPATYDTLMSVRFVAPGDVWAVGTSYGKTLMAHWDGASHQWSFFPSPNTNTNTNRLWAVAVLGPEDILAVGDCSDMQGQTLIEEYT